jgi:DNA segregation ATPase FtsK/SpoIIIE, S-DNA-T family
MSKRAIVKQSDAVPLRRALLCEAGGLAGAVLSVLLGLALLSQRPESGTDGAGSAGIVGSALARPLLLWLGLSALVLAGTCLGLSIALFFRRRIEFPGLKALGVTLLVAGSAALSAQAFAAAPFPFLMEPGPGGIFGAFLSDTLAQAFGATGSFLMTVLALLVGLAFTTGRLYRDLIQGFSAWLKNRAEAAAANREERRRQVPVEAAPAPTQDEKEERRRERIRKRIESQAAAEEKQEALVEAESASKAEPVETPAPAAKPKPRPKTRRSKRPSGKKGAYEFPPMDLLDRPIKIDLKRQEQGIQKNARTLEATFREFKIESEVVDFQRGPVVTLYEMEIAKGVKVGKLASYADDIAMALASQAVRIVAPIPGKSTVGIEVPNKVRDQVRLRTILSSNVPKPKSRAAVPLYLGMDVSGKSIVEDMEAMPHLLIAGSTGSGKSVCINAIIMSVIYTRTPDEVRLILIDPKQVELSFFAEIPHLLTPVVTDMRKAPAILEWAVEKMEQRYRLLALTKVRNIGGYNKVGPKRMREIRKEYLIEDEEELPDRLCHIVIVIDELADLMFMAQKEIEGFITRLAQKSRAVGIHVILATQRPQAQVVTGLIKANMPTRIAFKVISSLDSRVIMDRVGAERLLGAGDMLFLPPRSSVLVRAQGALVSDEEVRRVVEWLRERHPPVFSEELEAVYEGGGLAAEEKDPLYDEAARIVLDSQRGSASLLQRALAVGYTRASRLMDQMARDGIVGEFKGSKAREVMLTLEEWVKRKGE